MTISQKIKELRQSHGLTQMKLARAIGSTQASVQEWESGERRPVIDAVVALAKFFGVSTDYLLGLEDESGAKIQ